MLRPVALRPFTMRNAIMQIAASERYGSISQAFHWLTAILVTVAFLYGPGGSELSVYSPAKDADRQLHETLGLCVFVIAFMRILWRMKASRPAAPSVVKWMGVTATIVQYALYALLLAVPLTAITGAWLEGHPLTLLGGVQIPPPVAPSHSTGSAFATVHVWLGDAIMWTAGIHAVAAIYHHLVMKDNVLVSMLPRWFPLHPRR
jgi:cytochrome b561